MALPKWAEWLRLVSALLGAGLACLGAAMVPLEAYRWALIGAGAIFLALAVLLPVAVGVVLPIRDRWRQNAARKKLQKETRRVEAEQLLSDQEGRVQLREPCRAWEEFSYEAHRLVATLDSYRYDGCPSNWDRIMALRVQLTLIFVEALLPVHREQAKECLKPFQEATELNSLGFPLVPLRDWLFSTDRYYREV